MVEQNRVNLLWNCAKELSTQTHAERLLKSFYINISRKLVRHNVQLPEDSVGPARMCARCGNQWCDGNYELHLRPQRLVNNAKRRRLIAQLDAVKAKQQRGMLSTGARKRANWLKKRMASHVAVDCGFCGHKTMLPLEKPKKRAKSETVETMATAAAATTTTTTTAPTTTDAAPAPGKRKKKHTNKDVNAGLKIPMPTAQAQAQQKQKMPKAPTTTTAAKKATTTTTSGQSNKQKKKSKAAPTPAASNPQKMQSKTQKQNALLQLAAQLKTHASQNANKTQQNRLQALLK